MQGFIWGRQNLYNLVRERLHGSLFVVVSNREPYVHSFSGDGIMWNRPVGGLTQALDPVLRASGGVWIAHGSGDADRQAVDESNRVAVPPDDPQYTLHRVWLTDEEVEGYYLGFANEGLWPLCHITFTRPVFHDSDWEFYRRVNRLFADAVLEEVGDGSAVVFVQDYHLALLPVLLKEANPSLTVGQFWHIPWPPYEVFRTCPWATELLEGMLGNDLLGFHTQSFCDNFRDTVARGLPGWIKKGETVVQPFPISVDFYELAREAATTEVEREMEQLRREYGLADKVVGIGMDRMDYTKGIPERLTALDRFFEEYPEYRGKVVFIQAGMPSRTQLGNYRELAQKTEGLVAGINAKYSTDGWQPVIAISRQLTSATLSALRRLAHFCVVSSLHDGMNLVAKEYVSSRIDGDGVLVLSRFTGAACEMADALMINPYDTAEFALKIKEAVEMPAEERGERIAALRRVVAEGNIYRWGADMVSRLISIAEAR
jgi:trehalose 6-phosphate synthase